MRDVWDVCIVGAGIVGLTVARALVRRGVQRILILEKEAALGRHASGRNSGILHAGIYYEPGSLKARFCIEGNRRLRAFCQEYGLPLRETGKVLVPTRPADLATLQEIKRRADANGARAELVDGRALADIEPYASTRYDTALFVADTAVVDPQAILRALADELTRSGHVEIRYGTAALGPAGPRQVRTSAGIISYGWLVNAAGAYADRVAHAFGVGREYTILPLRGAYRRLRPDRSYLVRGNIFPVPDLGFPYLGVHLTRGVDDVVHVGPTAGPALGRAHYRGWTGLTPESLKILHTVLRLAVLNPTFRQFALREAWRHRPGGFLRAVRDLVPAIQAGDLVRAERVGIRAQLVHRPTGRLVMDFLVFRDEAAIHVLNAVSPAFTASMAFAEYLADGLM
ncbi:L-2-hydroxyglutarate oxidase LhgO [bacterium HR11]|nr:L-2-hydroxyglutarate oxidase LhgO [bacterium HR11]